MQEEQNENQSFDDSQEKNESQEEITEENAESKEALQLQINELKDQYMRAYADFENTKKRLIRDKDQALEYAYEKIAKDLLPSLDTLGIALKTICDSKEKNEEQNEILGKIEEGIALTLDNLLKTLAKHGIEPISTEGGLTQISMMQLCKFKVRSIILARLLQKCKKVINIKKGFCVPLW